MTVPRLRRRVVLPSLFVLAALLVAVVTTMIEPYFSYNRFATTGPYTRAAKEGASPATVGWPKGTGSADYPLDVGSRLCGPVNGRGIDPAPAGLVPARFRTPTTPVLVFMVTCTDHNEVRVECRRPSDCVAVVDRPIGRILVPAFGIVLCALLLVAALVVGLRSNHLAKWIGLALIVAATLAVVLTPLRSEMSLACYATGRPCYPPPSFLDLPIRFGIEIAVVVLALPLLGRRKNGASRRFFAATP
jgi:hypothetical protein